MKFQKIVEILKKKLKDIVTMTNIVRHTSNLKPKQ